MRDIHGVAHSVDTSDHRIDRIETTLDKITAIQTANSLAIARVEEQLAYIRDGLKPLGDMPIRVSNLERDHRSAKKTVTRLILGIVTSIVGCVLSWIFAIG